jgi:hypothetical protein
MKNKIPADVQTIIDYYDDNWLNYDFSEKTPAIYAAESITEGYRNITDALENYESIKDRDFSHFIGLGYPVSPAALKWAIDLLTKESK